MKENELSKVKEVFILKLFKKLKNLPKSSIKWSDFLYYYSLDIIFKKIAQKDELIFFIIKDKNNFAIITKMVNKNPLKGKDYFNIYLILNFIFEIIKDNYVYRSSCIENPLKLWIFINNRLFNETFLEINNLLEITEKMPSKNKKANKIKVYNKSNNPFNNNFTEKLIITEEMKTIGKNQLKIKRKVDYYQIRPIHELNIERNPFIMIVGAFSSLNMLTRNSINIIPYIKYKSQPQNKIRFIDNNIYSLNDFSFCDKDKQITKQKRI